MAIIDSVMYFGENDVLEIRLEELWGLVDKFIITEATITFSGKEKKMYWEQSKDRFKKYMSKIVYLVADLTPNGNPTLVEYAQRDYFVNRVDFSENDIFIISDIDEIPRSSTLKKYNLPVVLQAYKRCILIHSMHYYYVNCRCIEGSKKWKGAIVVSGEELKSGMLPSTIRRRLRGRGECLTIWKGGWHFSYLGGIEKIQEKIHASAHLEYDKEEFYSEEHLANCMANLLDMYKRDLKFAVDNGIGFPKHLIANRERFDHLFYKGA